MAQYPSICLRAQRACSVWYMGLCLRLVKQSRITELNIEKLLLTWTEYMP